MQIRDIMSSDVVVVSPNDTLQTAAQQMADTDIGSLPVARNDRLVGMVTDRDIVVRAVAAGIDPKETRVRDVMSSRIKYCFDDESVDNLAREMAALQVKRLPVLNRNKRLVGIVSLGDLALTPAAAPQARDALAGISQPPRAL